MKKIILSFAIGLASSLATQAAHAMPTLVRTNDRGVAGGQHYYEVYFQLDPGNVCDNLNIKNGYTELVGLGPSDPYPSSGIPVGHGPVYESYGGPSGYSNLVCQVNVYAKANSGLAQMWFVGTQYYCNSKGVCSGYEIGLNPGYLILAF